MSFFFLFRDEEQAMSRSRAQQPSSDTAWAQHGIAQAHTYFRGWGRRASQAARREFLDFLWWCTAMARLGSLGFWYGEQPCTSRTPRICER